MGFRVKGFWFKVASHAPLVFCMRFRVQGSVNRGQGGFGALNFRGFALMRQRRKRKVSQARFNYIPSETPDLSEHFDSDFNLFIFVNFRNQRVKTFNLLKLFNRYVT